MKFGLVFLGFVASQMTGALAAPSSADAKDCGELGVANWDLNNLAADENPNELRKCMDHPAQLSLKERNPLEKRACLKKSSWGCTKGFCWGECGKLSNTSFKWCWLAFNGGKGNWVTCSKNSDCKPGRGVCASGNCKGCGCSC